MLSVWTWKHLTWFVHVFWKTTGSLQICHNTNCFEHLLVSSNLYNEGKKCQVCKANTVGKVSVWSPADSSKHKELSGCQRVQFWSHLATSHSLNPPLNHLDVNLQTSDGPIHVYVPSWAGGPCSHCRISICYCTVCYQWFSCWLWSQVPWSLTSSSCVILGWSLTILMIILAPQGDTVVSFSPSFLLILTFILCFFLDFLLIFCLYLLLIKVP